MATEKACRKCKTIFEGSKCPKCGSEEFSDSHKGKIIVLKPEESELAKNLKITEKGEYALKLG
ncbi:MAG: DNA-directed RNA polymerase subunit E'' [archaeon]|jgi:DNA-directed RNA polymerase subunit E"|nr:DNA-directed RNA polymerase subunit E'' [archaeon]